MNEDNDLWSPPGPPYAPDNTAEESLIPLPTPNHMFTVPLAGLKAVVAVEQLLGGPEGC